MTLAEAFVPLGVAMLISGVFGAAQGALWPRDSVRALSAMLVVTSIAALPSLWAVSLGFLSHSAYAEWAFGWCSAVLGVHSDVPAAVGMPAVALTGWGLVSATRLIGATTRLRCTSAHRVDVLGSAHMFAYTLPGPAGRVVVSTALLDLLDGDERDVVFAHEHAHGKHRHDRYLLLATVGAALFPLLGHLSRRLRLALERWADEDAVAAVDGDRRLVARTIAKVALAAPPQRSATLGIAGMGATYRVQTLLRPLPPGRWNRAGSWCAVGATTVIAGYQLHHIAALVTALCHG